MASAFTRTLRALGNDSPTPRLLLGALFVPLLVGWLAWARLSKVSVYAVSPVARTEVANVAVPVEVSDTGRVLVSYLALGKHVEMGEVLLEIDSSLEVSKLEEQKTRVAGLRKRIGPMHAELSALVEVRRAIQRVGAARVGVAAARTTSARREAARARELSGISERMSDAGVGSRTDALQASMVVAQREEQINQSTAELLQLAESKNLETRQAALRELELVRQISEREGDIVLGEAAIRTLELSISHRTVRALATGYLGDVAPLTTGAMVAPGRSLATIIPEGALKIVAYFSPQETVGRVVPGQRAYVQFQGFPWTQFGVSQASVTSVGAEPRENAVRVELMLDPSTTTRIPLQHGMPASIEVEVDQTTPWGMMLRSIGNWSTPAPTVDATGGAPKQAGAPKHGP